jgi:solute carrier family 31 (copper transporter), member 1
MLWNWHTLDACFLTRSWRIRSAAGFAGTCLLVVLLVLLLEALRRISHEYDANLTRPRRPASSSSSAAATAGKAEGVEEDEAGSNDAVETTPRRRTSTSTSPSVVSAVGKALAATAGSAALGFRHDVFAQAVRALLHMLQFAVAYFVMLLAMYYNGYILLSIFFGAFLGAFLFGRRPVAASGEQEEEATYCCG